MEIKRFVAKYRLDVKATGKLENSSDSVAERIVEAPMGHVNNPSACVSKAVNGEMREEEIRIAKEACGELEEEPEAWYKSTIGQTCEGEQVPDWEDEDGGGEWCGEPTDGAVWYEGDDGGAQEDWKEGDDEEVADHGEGKSLGEDGW